LYYDVGRGFNSRHVSTAPVRGDNKFNDVKFKIPFLKILHHLRFDPPSISDGEIAISTIDIVDRNGKVLYAFNLHSLKPEHQIKRFDLINGNICFSMENTANDPQIRIPIDKPIKFDRFNLLIRLLIMKVIPAFFINYFVLFSISILLIYVWSRWTDPVIATFVIIAIVISGWSLYDDSKSVCFRLSMKSAVTGYEAAAELFYDQGYGLSGGNFVIVRTYGDDLFHDYNFKIPRNIRYLRLDPMTTAGTVFINKIEITDLSGNILKSFALDRTNPELSAEHQIKNFEFSDNGLKVTTEDGVNDPQIGILLDDISIRHINTGVFFFTEKTFINLFIITTLLIAAIVIWKRYGVKIENFIDGSFFQEKTPLLYLGCAFGLILSMAFISGLDVHPDELGHANSSGYYNEFWLPPSVDNPEILKTISGFGVSYLFRPEMVYFISGKYSQLLSGLVNENYLRLRLFNISLFLIMILIMARKISHISLLMLALVISPQIWYTFSYFNGDGIAFFIAILLALQIIYPNSLLNQYINCKTLPGKLPGKWPGGFLFGILIGSMLLSKMNYYIYLVFIFITIVSNHMVRQEKASFKDALAQIKKWALVACVALCVSLPPLIYDHYINDFKKDEKIISFVEKHADYPYKPSTIMNASDDSYPGLNLRSKGILWHEMFLEDSYWRKLSSLSLFGLYGYMNLYADSYYYEIWFMVLFGMILFCYFYAACTTDLKGGIMLCVTFIFLVLTVGQSVYFSWTADFEPQGRYLFPMIPILVVGLSNLPVFFKKRTLPVFNLILFVFSMISFVFYALLFIPKIA
jgi:hypothetical protein